MFKIDPSMRIRPRGSKAKKMFQPKPQATSIQSGGANKPMLGSGGVTADDYLNEIERFVGWSRGPHNTGTHEPNLLSSFRRSYANFQAIGLPGQSTKAYAPWKAASDYMGQALKFANNGDFASATHIAKWARIELQRSLDAISFTKTLRAHKKR